MFVENLSNRFHGGIFPSFEKWSRVEPKLPPFLTFLESLGRGGMGEVVKARDTRTGQQVAVKMVPACSEPEGTLRQRQEAETLAALSHPNVVRLVDSFDRDGEHFMLIELLEGGDLYDFLQRSPDLPQILDVFGQICRGLEYIHDQGLVHRDIKPGNILFSQAGVPKIADLGLVRKVGRRSELTQVGIMMGTAAYVSPEQIQSTRDVGPAGDLYSLGCTLFEALTGQWPFVRDSEFDILQAHLRESPPVLRDLRPDLPPVLDALMRRLLEKEPELRPRSAGQVREILLRALDAETVPTDPSEPEFEARQALDTRDPFALLLALSHDLRDPMHGVLGNARLLQGASLKPSERQYLEALTGSAREVGSLLQSLIDYTRLEFGRLRLEPVPTDLRGLLQSLATELSQLTVQVDVAVPDAVRCDPLRLRQVLESLLGRLGPGFALIKLHRDSSGPEGVGLRFVVSGGSGQAPELRSGGALLGQALTEGLIKKMGGQIWEDRHGLSLPLAEARPQAPELPAGQLQILLVDDSKITRLVVDTVLKLRGHEVTVANDGQMAVEMCGLADFDLILMDLEMPVMNGLEAARMLRAQGNGTPIVALTGHERQDWTRRCLEAGMNGFLSKPVEEPELLSAIAAALSAEAFPASTPEEPPVDPARFEELVSALEADWPDWLSVLDEGFRDLDAARVAEVAREIEGWLAALTALPAARAAGQMARLAEEAPRGGSSPAPQPVAGSAPAAGLHQLFRGPREPHALRYPHTAPGGSSDLSGAPRRCEDGPRDRKGAPPCAWASFRPIHPLAKTWARWYRNALRWPGWRRAVRWLSSTVPKIRPIWYCSISARPGRRASSWPRGSPESSTATSWC